MPSAYTIGRLAPAPEDLRYRRRLAHLPVAQREWWGIRANELADQGVPWPRDEQQAFAELEAGGFAAEAAPDAPRAVLGPKQTNLFGAPPAGSDPVRPHRPR